MPQLNDIVSCRARVTLILLAIVLNIFLTAIAGMLHCGSDMLGPIV